VSAPPGNCALCPRLAEHRIRVRTEHPDWFNAPVPSFGDERAELLIVGLAPGLGGANRTGRPFTGDYAGDLLYGTLGKFGFSTGTYERRPDDGLRLTNCRVTNAVRCLPPQNKPTGAEVKTCRDFLAAEIAALPRLRILLALGRIAHQATLACLGERQRDHPFGHGARHRMKVGLRLHDSYHCSRYNTNTGRLTEAMFEAVFEGIRRDLDA
jgi:uracil-DNA glycosylase family 4